jgi:hypothetical protein
MAVYLVTKLSQSKEKRCSKLLSRSQVILLAETLARAVGQAFSD